MFNGGWHGNGQRRDPRTGTESEFCLYAAFMWIGGREGRLFDCRTHHLCLLFDVRVFVCGRFGRCHRLVLVRGGAVVHRLFPSMPKLPFSSLANSHTVTQTHISVVIMLAPMTISTITQAFANKLCLQWPTTTPTTHAISKEHRMKRHARYYRISTGAHCQF